MEQEKGMVQEAQELAENTVVRNFSKLLEVLDNTEMFDLKDCRLDIAHGIGMTAVPLRKQHMAVDFLNQLANFLDVNILYAYRSNDGKTYRIVAYSMPYPDEMYCIIVNSEQYGIIEDINVVFFETIDTMLSWLIRAYERIDGKDAQYDIIQWQPLAALYRNFV